MPPKKKQKRAVRAFRPGSPATLPASAPSGLRIEMTSLSALEKWPSNPKSHSVDGIVRSIRRFGFASPVVVDERTGRLVAGHGRQEALSRMKEQGEDPPRNVVVRDGEWFVPVVRGNEFASEAEAERYLIADNRFVELGGWDSEGLLAVLERVDAPDLEELGFDEEELARLVKLSRPEAVPEKFVSFTAGTVDTNHRCPKCGYSWSE